MRRLARWLNHLEDGMIVLILLMMIGLAVYQIVLRNVFSSSLVWVEPLLQNAVLWIGLLGAMIASRRDEHIRIDLINTWLKPSARRWLAMVVDLFTCAVCAVVAWYSMLFLFEEMGQGGNAFPGVPSWILQAMIPIGFSVISVRYLIMFFLDLLHMRPPMQEPHA
ncbi:MAG: TRAP transporter small permease [Alcanivoracaceae bacterium]|jgi:TRAP-type C4-dicarboxylate transport system permease small subunit|nr:TRAP transporter small permease [Alcanivoracaceae bacterium]